VLLNPMVGETWEMKNRLAGGAREGKTRFGRTFPDISVRSEGFNEESLGRRALGVAEGRNWLLRDPAFDRRVLSIQLGTHVA